MSSNFYWDDKRHLIDPRGCYSGEELRDFESCALKVLEVLPNAKLERTRDAIQIDFADFSNERGIVIILTPEAIEFRLPIVKWLGTHTPTSSSQLWQRVDLMQLKNADLTQLIASAQSAQQQTFRECKYCKNKNPSGWMSSQDICQSCAEKYLGVVY